MKDKLPKLHVILHCCSALKVFPLKHNSYVRTQGNFTDILKYWQGHVYTRDSGNHLDSTLLFSYVPIGHRITQIQPECFFLHRPLPDLAFNLKWLITIFLRLGPYNRFIIKVVIHLEFQGDRFFVMDNAFSNLASLMSLPWWSFCILSNSEIILKWNESKHCFTAICLIKAHSIVVGISLISYIHSCAYNFQWHDYSQFSIISPCNHTNLFSHKRTPKRFRISKIHIDLLPPQGFRPEGQIPRRHSSNSRVY